MSDHEAQRIYRALFDRPVPALVADRFAAASERLEAHASPAELRAYRQAVVDPVDLEALELAARWTRRLPLLTRKFQLMAFLAETLPENQSLFINRRDNLPLAFAQISALTLRTAWLMAKGLLLVRRYGTGAAR
jgi:hypothetical protein